MGVDDVFAFDGGGVYCVLCIVYCVLCIVQRVQLDGPALHGIHPHWRHRLYQRKASPAPLVTPSGFPDEWCYVCQLMMVLIHTGLLVNLRL